jgi:hypothetical protein
LPPEALAEADQYVWTGTELKRREEVEGDTPPEHDQQPSRPRE